MAIGIGLHCMYCEHGPCDYSCRKEREKTKQEIRDEKIKKILKEQTSPEKLGAKKEIKKLK